MRILESLVAVLLLAVVIVLGFQVDNIESATQVSQHSAPGTIPTFFLSACGIALCAVIIQAALKRKDGGESQLLPLLRTMKRPRRLAFLTTACLFVLLLYPLGFIVSSILFISLTILLLCVNRRRETPINILVTVVATVLVYVIVVSGLESHLPEFRLLGG